MAEKQAQQQQRQESPQVEPEAEASMETSGAEPERAAIRRQPYGAMQRRGAVQSPFSMMRRMMDDMDRLFGDFGFGGFGRELSPLFRESIIPSFGELSPMASAFVPEIEVLERDGKLIVRADLPGIQKEDIHVTCDEDGLIIQGERKSSKEDEREGYFHSERSYGSFSRRIPIPQGADVQSCDASFDDGVLEISVALPKESRRRIEVRSRGEAAEGVEGGSEAPREGEEQVRH